MKKIVGAVGFALAVAACGLDVEEKKAVSGPVGCCLEVARQGIGGTGADLIRPVPLEAHEGDAGTP